MAISSELHTTLAENMTMGTLFTTVSSTRGYRLRQPSDAMRSSVQTG
ncbi:DUF7220 family protein [Qingshengfaniella alkalisoli]